MLANAVIIIAVFMSCMTRDNSILTWASNVFINKKRARYSLFRVCSEDFGLHPIVHRHKIYEKCNFIILNIIKCNFINFLGVSQGLHWKKEF